MHKPIESYSGKVNVSLGPMDDAYVELFVRWINAYDGIEGTRLRPPYTLEAARKWIADLAERKQTDEVFAILKRDSEGGKRFLRYIGHTGIHKITWPDGFGATKSMIDDTAQGRGYGTEAKLLLLNHCFNTLGLRKVIASVMDFNAPSLGHLIKCGYEIVGRYRQHRWHRGRYVDEIFLEVTAEQFDPIWNRYQRLAKLPKLSREQKKLVSAQCRHA